jgi:ribose 5-phosphate isomerase B
VAFGTDERTGVSDEVVAALAAAGHEVVLRLEDEPWPDVGRRVGEAVATGEADRGVVCCWTGTGVSIAANKVDGVRAALCTDAETARGARRWNDANVLALGLRLTSATVAGEMLDAFFSTDPDPDESDNVDKLASGSNNPGKKAGEGPDLRTGELARRASVRSGPFTSPEAR